MNLSSYDLALIAGAFTVLGALIGSLVTYWLSLQLAKAHARMEAGHRLREAFAPEIAMIDPVGGNKDANVDFTSARRLNATARQWLNFHTTSQMQRERSFSVHGENITRSVAA
jgi:hypothetical protein